MREQAWQRIGHLYPKVMVGNREEGTGKREEKTGKSNDPVPSSLLSTSSPVPSSPPSTPSSVPSSLSPVPHTVIAWLWARTVKCPNPACGCQMPLVRSFQLSTKKGKEAWVEPVVGNREEGTGNSNGPVPCSLPSVPSIRFVVKSGEGKAPEGTVERKGARCIACGTPVPFDHVRSEGRAGRMGQQLMAIVAEGQNGRVYLAPTVEQETIANSAQPNWKPDADLPHNPRDFKTPNYGMKKISDLFTPRQLVALTTFSDLVGKAREKATQDAIAAGLADDDVPLAEGGTGARAYGEAISVYLAFVLSKVADRGSTLGRWDPTPTQSGVINT